MQKHRIVLLILAATVATAASAQTVAPCEAYWNAAAVLVGRVESVKRKGADRVLSLVVVDPFRGVSSRRFDAVLIVPRSGSCLSFTPASEYVIYAERRVPDGAWVVNACGRTRPMDDAGADVEYARAVRQGTAASGYVTGHVSVGFRTITSRLVGRVRSAPIVTVTLTKGDIAVATTQTSGDAGWYRIDTPAAGAYRVSVTVPDGFYVDDAAHDVMHPDPRACAGVDVVLYDDGHVRGRVVDAKGRAVAGLTLELTAVAGGGSRRTVTDRDGRYALTKIPAGRFMLSVPGDPSRKSETRLYFPAAADAGASSRITVAAGERKKLPDFSIPAERAYVPVSGVVLDSGGAPAEGARIFLKGVGEYERIVSEPVFADFMGRFVIAARAGGEYGVFAERPRAGSHAGGVDATDTIRVTAADGLAPVRLVLERR